MDSLMERVTQEKQDMFAETLAEPVDFTVPAKGKGRDHRGVHRLVDRRPRASMVPYWVIAAGVVGVFLALLS